MQQNHMLLSRALDPKHDKPEITREEAKEYEPIRRAVPWRVKQQMLEEEDRVKARVLREQSRNVPITEHTLEEELAAIERDKENG